MNNKKKTVLWTDKIKLLIDVVALHIVWSCWWCCYSRSNALYTEKWFPSQSSPTLIAFIVYFSRHFRFFFSCHDENIMSETSSIDILVYLNVYATLISTSSFCSSLCLIKNTNFKCLYHMLTSTRIITTISKKMLNKSQYSIKNSIDKKQIRIF